MKRFLRAFLSFLERKFPDKVILTPAQLQALMKDQNETSLRVRILVSDLATIEAQLSGLDTAGEKLKKIEADIEMMQREITKFNASMGFATMPRVNAGVGAFER